RVHVALTLFEAARDELVSREAMAEKYSDAINHDIAVATQIYTSENMSEMIAKLSEYKAISLDRFSPTTDDEKSVQKSFKAYRECGKGVIEGLIKSFPIGDSETLFSHIADTYSICCELFALIQKVHERIMEKKLEKRILSFDDVAHFAYKALVVEGSYNHETREFTKTDYAISMGEKFNEILIDEYQDVNELQDTIFRAVSNSHNRFMVGDVKQSIYKFRGATPEIFMEYRNTFLSVDEERESFAPTLVSLQNNFRSDKSVVNFVNNVFEVIMNYRNEDIYRKDDHLVFSKKEDKELETELCIFNDSGELDFIADKILTIVEGGDFSFSDICILARNHKSLIKVQEALTSRLIPSDYTPNKSFFESYEISTILSFLRACDNPSDDVPILATLTSPVFHFTPSDLLTLRRGSVDTDIYFAVAEYARKGADESLKSRCQAVIERLASWREASRRLSSESFIWHIYQDTHLQGIAGTLNNADERRKNLISFYEMARSYERNEFKGITKFLSYVDNILTQKKNTGE
ncbi:MAG: UvrD-helicase domain-containing protein, partial [Clostridia bacterium]|nr:UvrD-helicase domain-containing protein [Clostridia bacterium]